MKRRPIRPARFAAEPLEERLVLSASVFPSPLAASLPNTEPNFVSASDLTENPSAFLPIPGAASVSTQTPASTASSEEFYIGTYYDVNKYRDGTDSQMCWAAAMTNVLVYTNWGYSTAVSGESPEDWLFSNEYEIYDYFLGNFTNKGGHAYYAFPWFADGTYSVQGNSSWSQVVGDGGYLFPGISIPDVRHYLTSSGCGGNLIGEMAGYLEQGYGVVLALGWYSASSPTRRTGGHSITVWGYTYDVSLDPSDPNYYTGLIVTNSDDNYTGTKTMAVEYSEEYGMYRLSDYSGGRGWIEDFTCIKPVETLTGVSASGYTGVYDGLEHTVTVDGIPDSGDDEYTVIYNYGGTFSLEAPVYTEPGTYPVVVVAVKNEFDAIWSAPVTVTIREFAPEQLAAPEITSIAPAGLNRHALAWTEIAGAAAFEIAWSADGGEVWSSLYAAGTETLITDLVYGETLLYRVRALGDGEATLTSGWSAETSLLVNPVDLDGDGFVGPGDYALLSAAWFADPESETWDPRFDIDGDGFVGPGDYAYLSSNWFKNADDADFRYPAVQS
ncbi:MAG: hypothetical protein IKE69_05800 [Thermoguttaceae bacterium]|nr:hypothetical protein [Thermoguttaceae bacterium]